MAEPKSKQNNKAPLNIKTLTKQRDTLIEEYNTVQKAFESAAAEQQQRLGKIGLLNELIQQEKDVATV